MAHFWAWVVSGQSMIVIIVIHLILVLGMIGSRSAAEVRGRRAGQLDQRLYDRPRHGKRLDPNHGRVGVLFFITSLGLSWLAGMGRHPASIISTRRARDPAAAGRRRSVGAAQPGRRRRPQPTGRRQSARAGGSAGAERAASAAVKIGQRAMAETNSSR